jgi:putative phage-type endonuclease
MVKNKQIKQLSSEWFHKRKGAITGTRLGKICGTPKARQEMIYEIVGERLKVGVEEEYEDPRDRGIRLEDEAVAQFEFSTGLSVEKCGFCESDDDCYIAYSPDGIISGTDDTEDVEVKCPLEKNFVKIWLTNEIPEEYYYQILQAFVVNEKLKKRYFIAYNPEIQIHPLHIIEIKREEIEEDILKAKESQKAFLAEVEAVLSKIISL